MTDSSYKTITVAGVAITAVLSLACAFISLQATAVCIVLGTSLCLLFAVTTKKRINRIAKLNNYLSLVIAGEYNLDIPDNTEGEMSILKNNLYKVIKLLNTQNETLKSDKLYLADSLADISHQLKTPLTSLMVMTDLLKSETDTAKKAEFISVMEAQLDKMKWLISTLLTLSKLDAGVIEFKKEPFSLKLAMSEVLKPFLIAIELKQITLVADFDDITVSGDKGWFVQALQNIVKNSIEHTDKNGKLLITAKDTNIYTQINISDTGCGISEQDIEHIFERFYHTDNASKDSVGIGLALSKAVIEKHNGSVTASSKIGEGTDFEIKLYKSIV